MTQSSVVIRPPSVDIVFSDTDEWINAKFGGDAYSPYLHNTFLLLFFEILNIFFYFFKVVNGDI